MPEKKVLKVRNVDENKRLRRKHNTKVFTSKKKYTTDRKEIKVNKKKGKSKKKI